MLILVTKKHLFYITFLTFLLAPTFALAIPAFPGAQGGGATATGGRGGAVIEVTNLNDSGAGSLRACVLASGPRTCVFRVGGTIQLLSSLRAQNPFLTIAGQTAPGGGIQLSGKAHTGTTAVIATHDVVWRYTRIRGGYKAAADKPGAELGATFTCGAGCHNVTIDHNSVSWNQDEGIGVFVNAPDGHNITISSNLVAEGFANHPTGVMVSGSGTRAQMVDVDLHRNLTMNENHRSPALQGATMRYINNITYNIKLRNMQFGWSDGVVSKGDFIGNIWKKGPLNLISNPFEVSVIVGPVSLYIQQNRGYTQPDPNGDQWIMVRKDGGQNGPDIGQAPTSWRRFTPLPNLTYPISAEPVATLEGSLLPVVGDSRRLDCAGNWVSSRDTTDARLVNQYNTNTGNTTIINNESQVGGFPVIANGTACGDGDHDGMPDVWETAKGLNPNNKADGNGIGAGGFTNLEIYLAGSGANTTPQPGQPPPPPTGPYVELTITPSCFANADLNDFALAEHPSTGANTNQPSLSLLDLLKKNLASVLFFWR